MTGFETCDDANRRALGGLHILLGPSGWDAAVRAGLAAAPVVPPPADGDAP